MTANQHTTRVGYIGLGDQGALREMQLVDMDIFADAVHDLGDRAADFTNRAVHGAKALPELAARIH